MTWSFIQFWFSKSLQHGGKEGISYIIIIIIVIVIIIIIIIVIVIIFIIVVVIIISQKYNVNKKACTKFR